MSFKNRGIMHKGFREHGSPEMPEGPPITIPEANKSSYKSYTHPVTPITTHLIVGLAALFSVIVALLAFTHRLDSSLYYSQKRLASLEEELETSASRIQSLESKLFSLNKDPLIEKLLIGTWKSEPTSQYQVTVTYNSDNFHSQVASSGNARFFTGKWHVKNEMVHFEHVKELEEYNQPIQAQIIPIQILYINKEVLVFQRGPGNIHKRLRITTQHNR